MSDEDETGEAEPKKAKAEPKKAKAEPKKGKADAKKGKNKGRRKGDGASADAQLSISAHPRARHSVRQAKAWVALIGFGLTLVLSMQAGVPLAIAAERALMAGIAGYLVAWGCAVAVWRALLVAELRAHAEALKASREQGKAALSK